MEESIERKSEALNVISEKHGHTVECTVYEYGSCRDIQRSGLEKYRTSWNSAGLMPYWVEDIA